MAPDPARAKISPKDRRPLGNTGILLSPIGFGSSPLGHVFGAIDHGGTTSTWTNEKEDSGIAAVHEAVKSGINYFDVSPFYGETRAETVLGKALRQLPRESFVLSTKVGRYGQSSFDFSAGRVTRSIDESMERLGVDRFDIVLCHDVEFADLDQIVTETLPALKRLKDAGKIDAIGVSGFPLEIFPYIIACAEAGSVDVILSYCNYNLQNERLRLLLPWLHKQGIGVINASVLSMGLLTPGGGPEWHPADEETKAACRRAAEFCEARGKDLATVALQFALGDDDGVIASTLVGIDSPETLRKNLEILETEADEETTKGVRSLLEGVRNRRWKSGKL